MDNNGRCYINKIFRIEIHADSDIKLDVRVANIKRIHLKHIPAEHAVHSTPSGASSIISQSGITQSRVLENSPQTQWFPLAVDDSGILKDRSQLSAVYQLSPLY